MTETNENKLLLIAMGRKFPDTVLFRNNTGMGWVGNVVSQDDTVMVIKDYRPLHAGLVKGSSDNIGWTSIVVTADMVGKRVALFTAIESKKAKKGVIGERQHTFINNVNEAGGIGIFSHSPEQGVDAFSKHPLILTR